MPAPKRTLLFSVLLWLLASSAWSAFLLYQTREHTLAQTFRADASSLANLLSEHLSATPATQSEKPHALLRAAQPALQSDLEQAARYTPSARYIMLWATDGEVIAHTNRSLRGTFLDVKRWPALEPNQPSRLSTFALPDSLGNENVTEITVPLTANQSTLAYLSFAFPPANISSDLLQTLRPLLILCTIIILAGALATALLVRLVQARLEKRRQEILNTARARTSMLTERGMLASVLAHEVRSPLTALRFNLHALRTLLAEISSTPAPVGGGAADETAGDHKIELTDRCEREIRRLDGMLNDFLQRTQVIGPPESTPVNAVITEALEFLRPALERKNVRLSIHLDPADPRVNVHPDELRQVILNLAANAHEAMPSGGTLAVSTITEEEPTPSVTLLIRDSGVGIPAHLHQRIFEPFFSTKANGSGLGLALVRRVVSGAGGTVSCESIEKQVGGGTTFRITLPRSESTSTPTGQGYTLPQTQDMN